MTKLYLGLATSFIILSSCSLPQAVSYNISHSLGKRAPQTAPPVFGKRKIGKPYQIDGKWYFPVQSSEGYREYGVASWYGKDFHSKKTSNGEIYNMYEYTAAHKTLPLPTYARVTNTQNGKSIVVRINDRGPFVKDRLIDMSYAGAKALGMDKQGTASVLVEAISTYGGYGGLSKPKRPPSRPAKKFVYMPKDRIVDVPFTVRVANRKALIESKNKQQYNHKIPKVLPKFSAESDKYFIQFGSFANLNNARNLFYKIRDLYSVKISQTKVDNRMYYRVISEDVINLEHAEKKLQDLQKLGFHNAILRKIN